MDVNVRAFRVVQAALTEKAENPALDIKKASGRKGGLLGGPSRARSISPEQRSEIARKASTARWARQKN